MNNPEPTQLVGTAAVAAALEVNRAGAQAILSAELAGETFKDDRGGLLARAEDIADLATWRRIEPSRRALQVKVAAAVWSESEGRWRGWHRRLSQDQRRDGVRGWWAVRDPDALKGADFLATLGGFVVEVARIVDYENGFGKRNFTLDEPDEAAQELYRSARIPAQAGSVIGLWHI
ncbi:MAG: hypothetical protein QM673_16190 [Gordonia sp. (in: high G+C Gram-positive bacteria)]